MNTCLPSRRRLVVLLACSLVVVSSSFLLVTRSSHSEGPEATVLAIRKVLDGQERDWNKGDLDAFLGGYWHSKGVVFQSGGNRNVGFDAMRERYNKSYKAEGKSMGRLTFSDLEIHPITSDTAYAIGRWGLVMPDGKTPGGLFTLIFKKFPEGWRIVLDHTSAAETPEPKASTPPAG